ncbi:MAG: MFS transporter [Bifidobacteriaceae bacterium]|jgi:MFS family permease|nr:MFS transporter [Bifidobacteriaceae bacterium]
MAALITRSSWRILAGVIGVEFVSGILGAYYTPLTVPLARSVGLADGDWNWVEAAMTLFGAIIIPVMTKVGDRIGHKKALLAAVGATAAAAWWVVAGGGIVPVMLAFSLMSFSAVWVALELALLRSSFAGAADSAEKVSAASAALIVSFMAGSVGAALFGGQFFTRSGGWAALEAAMRAGADVTASAAFTGALRMTLLVPAVGVTLVVPLVAFLVPQGRRPPPERQDLAGMAALIGILLLVVGGLSLVKLLGPQHVAGWAVIALGLAAVYPFGRHQLRAPQPTVDLRVLSRRSVWPYQAVSVLLGVGYTATQIPLVTFASTDPAVHGYGLAADSGEVSVIMAVMIVVISATAGLLTAFGARLDKLALLRVAPFVHAGEFAVFLVWHTQMWHACLAVAIGGVGAGILVAWLPATAANAAPPGKTASLVGLVTLGRVVGTAVGSAVFAVVLGAVGRTSQTAAALPGYLAVFAIALASSLAGGAVLACGARPPLAEAVSAPPALHPARAVPGVEPAALATAQLTSKEDNHA